MDQQTTATLDQALELLNADQLQKASALLARVLSRDSGNERAWHMLSYALTDRKKQIYALERVLQINPANRAARSQLARLSEKPAVPPASRVTAAAPVRQQGEPAAATPAQAETVPHPVQPVPATAVASAGSIPYADAWRTASAAQATATTGKIIPFPGAKPARKIKYSPWQRLRIRWGLTRRRLGTDWRVFSQSPLAILGVGIIVAFAIMAVAHPILIRTVWPRPIYDPVTGFDIKIFTHPSPPAWVEGGSTTHLLGTDMLGRDVLSMLLAATTPTFIIGITAALTTAIVGTSLSVIAAYFRGPADAIITNLADVFLLFPAPIIMVIVGARFRDLGPVPLGMIYGLVTGAGATVLVLRAHALQVVSKPYMEAAQISGGGGLHIITKHLLPAMLPLAALQMMIAVTGAVVADGFISFFGLTRNVSNWGTLIYDAFVYGNVTGLGASDSLWHMLLPAALCFSLFALGFYLVSRGLHRVASPIIREEQLRM
jgi:peptide/nickel transport system permease protein